MKKACGLCLALLMIYSSVASAQSSMPTANILTRVLMVQSQYGRDSIFSIDVDNREYWITAKHILTGAQHPPYGSITVPSVSLQMLDPGSPGEKWIPVLFSVIDTAKDVDIVVLAPREPLLKNPLPSEPSDTDGASLGGDCEFLGFPYGGGWRATIEGRSYWMPFVKHCTVSSIADSKAATSATERVWILDGINNEGFSGGPVVFRTGPDQKIMAVVSGYVTEPADVISSGARKAVTKSSQTTVQATWLKANVNSGFIIAYDIHYVVDAIQMHPIGALRNAR